MKRFIYFSRFAAILLLAGCVVFVKDPSMNATQANANNLISFHDGTSACTQVPFRGVTACEIQEGSQMASVWKAIVPFDNKHFLSGQITLRYRDLVSSYPMQSSIIEIPWAEFFKSQNWGPEHDGIVVASAKIRFVDDKGVEGVFSARGIVFISIYKKGYEPIAIDSGFLMYKGKIKCDFGYSTAGRSAVKCEED